MFCFDVFIQRTVKLIKKSALAILNPIHQNTKTSALCDTCLVGGNDDILLHLFSYMLFIDLFLRTSRYHVSFLDHLEDKSNLTNVSNNKVTMSINVLRCCLCYNFN